MNPELNEKYKEPNLELDEEKHEYKYKGVTLTSVTTLLDKYKLEFDEEKLSLKTSEKTGRTQQEILDEWNKKKEYSQVLGTSVHLYAEELVKGSITSKPVDDYDTKLRLVVDNYFKEHTGLVPIASELRVVLPVYKLAGTIDLIMKSKENEKVFLYDFKTSKEITTKSYNKKLLEPLDYLDDCNFVKYCLQLSMYKLLLKKRYNISIDGCYIIHITKDGYKEFKCIDYTSECEVILLLHLLDLNKKV